MGVAGHERGGGHSPFDPPGVMPMEWVISATDLNFTGSIIIMTSSLVSKPSDWGEEEKAWYPLHARVKVSI